MSVLAVVPSGDVDVARYYEEKTESILQRYGPGPRVHFHTGVVDDSQLSPAAPLKARIHQAQERLLERLATVGMPRPLEGKELLDVGCGLGGGSLFWADRHGAQVTAITIAPSHPAWVMRFAQEAGVASRVNALLCDALEVEGSERFDAIVAVESACYLPRTRWMQHVAQLLKPQGRLLIADCFLGRPELAAPFDLYWRTHIGTRAEYRDAARQAGLALEQEEDLSSVTAPFWELTLELMRGPPSTASSRSEREHLRLLQGLQDGGLSYALQAFRRS